MALFPILLFLVFFLMAVQGRVVVPGQAEGVGGGCSMAAALPVDQAASVAAAVVDLAAVAAASAAADRRGAGDGWTFSEPDRQRIADAIRAVEARTSGEIVCVVARACGTLPDHCCPVVVTGGPARRRVAGARRVGLSAAQLIGVQSGIALLAFLVLHHMPLRMALVPRRVKQRRAARLARTQFLGQGCANGRPHRHPDLCRNGRTSRGDHCRRGHQRGC